MVFIETWKNRGRVYCLRTEKALSASCRNSWDSFGCVWDEKLFSMPSLNGRGTWHQQQHQIIKSKGYENYYIDDQRENALILNQILSTILKRNTWWSVLRICMWILGLKVLNNSTYLVYCISDWRTAFELSGTIRDILSYERQIVVRGFYGERDSFLSGLPDHGQGAGWGKVHDMTRNPKRK